MAYAAYADGKGIPMRNPNGSRMRGSERFAREIGLYLAFYDAVRADADIRIVKPAKRGKVARNA